MTTPSESTAHSSFPGQTGHGQIVVVTGPSGVGKGTLCKLLLNESQKANDTQLKRPLQWSISATTRAMRPGEVDGQDYFFWSEAEFRQNIDAGHLLEWAQYNGNYYGTPKQGIQQILADGSNVLLEIDVQGALNVRQLYPEACLIFLMPPDETTLKARLTNRNTNTPAEIEERLAIALHEMTIGQQSGTFDYVVINQVLTDTFDTVVRIINNEAP